MSTRETERMSYPGPLPLLYEDEVGRSRRPKRFISTVEQNIEVDSVDETPGSLVVYCMRIYDCMIYKNYLSLIKMFILLCERLLNDIG